MTANGTIGRLLDTLNPPDQPNTTRRAITDQEITALLAAAQVAPSAQNLQTWRFVVVRAPDRLVRLAATVPSLPRDTVATASAMLVVCGVKTPVNRARREQPFALIDVPIALCHVLLQATEMGLPYAWTLAVDEDRCRRLLRIPQNVQVVALVTLG